MSTKTARPLGLGSSATAAPAGVEMIKVAGFKSLRDPVTVQVKPLTLLAGQNSAGKSSLMQPLLLLKQTLEAPYDVSPLLLDGPCVRVHDAHTLSWRGQGGPSSGWSVGVKISQKTTEVAFSLNEKRALALESVTSTWAIDDVEGEIEGATVKMSKAMGRADAANVLMVVSRLKPDVFDFEVTQRRCFFVADYKIPLTKDGISGPSFQTDASNFDAEVFLDLIHLPGLRGNPERSYPITQAGGRFPGAFHHYAAGVLLTWSERQDGRLQQVSEDLSRLGLTWKVQPKKVSDASAELLVGRHNKARKGGARDLVSIADVGFGLSQVLPVVVALRAATPGQMVHIEQPELHLHPNAQVRLTELLMDAANRGVRVVVETHSALLLKALQVAVAEGRFAAEKVSLNWFARDAEGATTVTFAALDENGAFGSWPVDFSEVELDIERRYISAPFRETP